MHPWNPCPVGLQRALLWSNDPCDVRWVGTDEFLDAGQGRCAYKNHAYPQVTDFVRIYKDRPVRIKIRIAGALPIRAFQFIAC